jgi:hypoxia up-regulated 1
MGSEQVTSLKNDFGIRYDFEQEPETGRFWVVLDRGADNEMKMRPEEVVGMILGRIKGMSQEYTGEDVSDCVITVPSQFTQAQREALLDSAAIAGLNVLTLVDENVAAAVQHGIYNEFSNSSHLMLLYNMGSEMTQVTLFRFWGKPALVKNQKATTQIEVLAHEWDDKLGGSKLDMVMLNLLADRFDAEHKLSPVRENQRATERLRAQATKVKVILSANAEIPVSIESLHEKKDLKTLVTRKEFESAAKDTFDRVLAPVERVLASAGVTVADINSIELIGGGIRVPRVKEKLSELFGDMELGSHLNGDESKAFGAVFVAANMSKAFRVRPVGLQDVTSDAVLVELGELEQAADAEPWTKEALLFNASSALGQRKIVKFNRTNDIACTLVRKGDNGKLAFAKYTVTGVKEAIDKFGQHGKPKISLTFHLSLNDTVGLQKAEAVFVEEIAPEPEEEETEAASEAAAKDTEEASADSSEESAEKDDSASSQAAGEEEQAAEGEEKGKEGEDSASEAKEQSEEDKKKKPKKPKKNKPTKKTHRFSLTMTRINDQITGVKPMTQEAMKNARELLQSWDQKEAEKREHEAAKNQLESFIFGSRDKLRSNDEEIDIILSAENKEKLFDDLEALEDWLDGDGEDAPVKEYKERRAAMDKRIKQVMQRLDELDQRPAAIRASNKFVASVKAQIANVWPKERPWITKAEKQFVLTTLATFEGWLSETAEKQDKTSLQEDPVLTTADIVAHLEPVHDVLESALRRAPPRPPKKKKEEPKKEDDKEKKDGEGEKKEEDTSDKKEDEQQQKEEEEKDEL